MREFTENDVGTIHADKDGKEWVLLAFKTDQNGMCVWRPAHMKAGWRGQCRTTRHGVRVNEAHLENPTVFIAPPFNNTAQAIIHFTESDRGNTYRDHVEGLEWVLDTVGPEACLWVRHFKSKEAQCIMTTTSGWEISLVDTTMPTKTRRFKATDEPVALAIHQVVQRHHIGKWFVDNEGDRWVCRAYDQNENVFIMRHTTAGNVVETMRVYATGHPQVWTKRLGRRNIVSLADMSGLYGVMSDKTPVEVRTSDAMRAAFEPETVTINPSDVDNVVNTESHIDMLNRHVTDSLSSTHGGKTASIKTESSATAPTDHKAPHKASSLVQTMLINPSSKAVRKALKDDPQKYHLAHSICAQLFLLETLLKEDS